MFGACFRLINDRTCRLGAGCKVMTREGPRGSFSMMKIHLTFKRFLDSKQLDENKRNFCSLLLIKCDKYKKIWFQKEYWA